MERHGAEMVHAPRRPIHLHIANLMIGTPIPPSNVFSTIAGWSGRTTDMTPRSCVSLVVYLSLH